MADQPIFDHSARSMLGRLADYYLPVHSPETGQAVYDIATYLETLFTALEDNPPRIFGGGPFSDRHPQDGQPAPANDFKAPVPLSRYQRLAWKLRLGGPDALSEEPFIALDAEVKRDFTGLIEIITIGVRRAEHLSDSMSPRPVIGDQLLSAAGPDFRREFPKLVAEAAFSPPEYFGNLSAWKEIYYPGDSLPRGYAGREVSDADAGADPFPIHSIADLLLWLATVFQNGKEFK